jgi:hypothetical protein
MMRYVFACALLAVLALVSVGAASAQPAGALPGQWLLSISENGDEFSFNIDCRPGETSTISFSVSGDAIAIWGGYDGTFTEQGTVTIGPTGRVTGFSSTFTIFAHDGTVVTGTKTLDTRETVATGECTPPDASGSCSADTSPIDLTYTATTEAGTESGTARTFGIDAFQTVCGGATHGAFEEEFLATDAPPPAPTTLTLEPATAVNPVDEAHTVTATLLDQYGMPVQDYAIQFTVTGAVSTTGTCITDVLGQCTFTFTGASFPGAATITACSDAHGDGSCEAESATAAATKEFILPASTPGATTGGGRIGTARVTVTARSHGSGPEGTCTVVTSTATVNCLDVTAYVQTGPTSIFFGRATVNDVATTYRIRVVDAADSGSERDVFSLVTSSGFTLTGTLTEGNLQVHDDARKA